MNTVTLTGTVATAPSYYHRAFMHNTEFDIELPARSHHRCPDRFHIVAHNQLAKDVADLAVGTVVAITGFLRSEPVDMPDRSVWHQVEIGAYEVDVINTTG